MVGQLVLAYVHKSLSRIRKDHYSSLRALNIVASVTATLDTVDVTRCPKHQQALQVPNTARRSSSVASVGVVSPCQGVWQSFSAGEGYRPEQVVYVAAAAAHNAFLR